MGEMIKMWENGQRLTATYEGSGDGEAVFASETNDGIDREMAVTFRDKGRTVAEERTVRQEGLREEIRTADGALFKVKDGIFGVLKVGGVEPPVMETYTILTYLESTGEQYIEIPDYTLQESDEIEVLYNATSRKSEDQFIFGAYNSWVSTYNNTAYARFGHSSSVSITNGAYKCKARLSKGKVAWDGGTANTALTYTSLSGSGINVFGGRSSDGGVYNKGSFRIYYFRIYNGDNRVVDLVPVKRDSDGVLGMLDVARNIFYTNAAQGADFISGSEMRIGDDYERMDSIAFNDDRAFDTGVYGNEQTYIDIMFQRTDTSGADYLLGCSSGNRLTAYLTSSGYWRYGSGYPTFNCNNKDILVASITPTKTTVNSLSGTFTTSAYTTAFTLPIGGHKPASGTITKAYKGVIYYVKIRHGEVDVIDWYPCRRKSDGAIGFWDCINQEFVESI